MAVAMETRPAAGPADKAELRRILERQDQRDGFVVDEGVTVAEVHRRMLRDGVRPEKNDFSREILRARNEDVS
ncbi:MAG: hypothetical protein HY321_06920 [Armatimonadetes bacterium]|nr:hypothetical protein [Armatimonadota bacterium]